MTVHNIVKYNVVFMHIHKTLQQNTGECLALLRSTNREKIEDLISHITNMGYFDAPGSKTHHRFVGGLVSHSLDKIPGYYTFIYSSLSLKLH